MPERLKEKARKSSALKFRQFGKNHDIAFRGRGGRGGGRRKCVRGRRGRGEIRKNVSEEVEEGYEAGENVS